MTRLAFAWVGTGILASALFALDGPFRGFPRYDVGDPSAENPLRWTEGPKSVRTLDMNGDGRPDLVTGNLDGSVSVLLNRGDGSFGWQILGRAGGSLRGIAASDFTGDGVPDVAAADLTGHVVILAGTGTGTLQEVSRIPLETARALEAADFDGDGAVDLAAVASWEKEEVCPPSQLFVLLGRGDGTFESTGHLPLPRGACLFDLEVADLTRDGIPDILALDQKGRRLLLYAGDGLGGFELGQVVEPLGYGPRALCVAFIDERMEGASPTPEAALDVVVANRDSATITLFRGRPDGRLDPMPAFISAGRAPRGIAAADLDGDGWNDLLVVNRNTDRISILHAEGRGRFTLRNSIPTGRSPRAIAVADLDGDGAPDAAVANRLSQDVSVFRGRVGLPSLQVPRGTYEAGISAVAVVTADLDEDGRLDVAVANDRSHDLQVRLSVGDGRLEPRQGYPLRYRPSRMVASDLDGDGHQDIAVACLGTGRPGGSPDLRGSVVTLLGRGDGTFAPGLVSSADVPDFRPYAIRTADFDGDGAPDLAVADFLGRLFLLRGRGDGTFEAPQERGSLGRAAPVSIAAGDFDGDGDIDIATSMVRVLLNEGRLFDPEAALTWKDLPTPPGRPGIQGDHVIESGDLNGDGILDLAIAITFVGPRGVDPIAVYFGQGDGSFDGPYELPTGRGVTSIAMADFTGDGIVDIASGNRCSASMTILKGRGGTAFDRIQDVKSPPVEGLAVADFDGDDLPDLVGVGDGVWIVLNGGDAGLADPEDEMHHYRYAIETGLVINEVMASNLRSYFDEGGDTPDWVELYNPGPEARGLGGMRLVRRDPDGDGGVWRIPGGVVIEPGAHRLIFCDEERGGPGELHADFRLPRDGFELALLDGEGREVDRVSVPRQIEDVSFARFVDGARFLDYNPEPTPGGANTEPTNISPIIRLIGESPLPARPGEPLEVLLQGFDEVGIVHASVAYVTGERRWWELDRIREVQLEEVEGGAGGTIFRGVIPPQEDGTVLSFSFWAADYDGEVVTLPGDPDDAWFEITWGYDGPRLRIDEVLADNDRGIADERGQREDWLSIRNCDAAPVSLDGFALAKGFSGIDSRWPFPGGLVLEPGERLLVFCDDDPEEGPLHATFKLDRDGDEVLLLRAGGAGSSPRVADALRFAFLPPDVAFGIQACDDAPYLIAQPDPPPVRMMGTFVRGDGNGDGAIGIGDAIVILGHLFAGGSVVCQDAADVDDDGRLTLGDPVRLLNYLFAGGGPPAPPFPEEGLDPTPDGLRGC